jgi:hypothetical protein|tara:strand:+ start:166 stop:729 length:564 start_codon:yes stop_codon:yes gene_type:complete
MDFLKVNKILNDFGKYVVQQSKSNLSKTKPYPQNKGALYNSIKYTLDSEKDIFLLDFLMEPYGTFVDKGVKGKNPNALPKGSVWSGIQKAPTSPYKFGSMKSKGLRKAINKWTVQKGLKGIRDPKTGRFLPRKSMQYLISRSIYLSGIKASMFFTKPFEQAFKRLTPELTNAYLLDIEQAIILGTKK